MGEFEYADKILRKMQLIELEMLVEFDRICRKYDINYIIDAGTLLGAVRHSGFIPWDDDVDIRMLREDYIRFCEVCKFELSDKYFLQNYNTDKGYRWGFARILKNGTVFIRKGHEELKSRNGVFIDIFPNDNLPDTFPGFQLCTLLSLLCRKMLYSELGKIHAKTALKRAGFFLLDIFPKSWAHQGYEYLVKRYGKLYTNKVRCFGYGSREETIGFQREWFEDICEIEFEGISVKAPKKTHEFLVFSFGEDYMTPPPVEKRKPNHTATYIKLD